jgi:hypothetical protein
MFTFIFVGAQNIAAKWKQSKEKYVENVVHIHKGILSSHK